MNSTNDQETLFNRITTNTILSDSSGTSTQYVVGY